MILENCIPADKHDTDAVDRAAAAGFPAVNAILPDLLEWVMDPNWPVAMDLYPLLAQAGPEIVPAIRHAFEDKDAGWHWALLCFLVPHLREPAWKMLRPDVVKIATSPTQGQREEEADQAAREVLADRGGDEGDGG